MPEIVTKYPNLALQELKDAGIKCGVGAKQQILITCPKENFCALPTGEICVYGIKDVPQMTQITALDLFLFPQFAIPLSALGIMILALGMLLGTKLTRRGKPKT